MKCGGCNTGIKEGLSIACDNCKFRFCFPCLNVPSNIKTKSEIGQDLLAKLACPHCVNINTGRRLGRNEDTPTSTKQGPNFNLPLTSTKELTFDENLLDSKLANFAAEIKNSLIQHINSKIQELKQDFTNTTDFIMNEVKDLQKKLHERDDLIKNLVNDQENMKKDLFQMSKRMATMDKLSRDRNIELQAIPETKEENLINVISSVCSKVNFPLKDADVQSCRRVARMDKNNARPRNVLVTFSTPRVRDGVLSADSTYTKEKRTKLSTSDIGLLGNPSKIYICEHLSPECKQLHAAARKFKLEMEFKYVWVKNGQVYLRRVDNEKAVRITSINDLEQLKMSKNTILA
ncbi:hypothetical protein O0L34_g18872 [Tuta absoluta]|nr:hypothetical protein O0L34_g18872 [Tuta absoluta]